MHNFIKAGACIFAIGMLAGCGGNGVKVDFADKTYEAGTSLVKAAVPVFESEMSQEFADSINQEYDEKIMSILDTFMAKTQALPEESEFLFDSEVKTNNGRLVSVVSEAEVFTGGAHGEKFRISRSFDFENGKEIKLEDIFVDDSWKTIVNERMKELCESGDEEYSELWEEPSVEILNAEDFYIEGDKLVLYYPPYKLSYYRRGFVEFKFKVEELSGYMTDYIKELMLYGAD